MGWWSGGVVGNLAEISPSPYLPKSLSTVFRLRFPKKGYSLPYIPRQKFDDSLVSSHLPFSCQGYFN
ncbi:MAG: hypothetical protein EWV60_16805 [Microcystis sp. Msp_OC_L_20101000_S702]|nr:MAG: hypothetical protein EWV60_16805 [Microcystis sp. Msp_OC_L_20101000_S702]